MRYLMIGLAVAAFSAAAVQAQSAWGTFESGTSSGVGLQGSNGAQLLLKCDKPGKGSVYATVATPKDQLVPPSQTFTMRPVKLRFDGSAPKEDRWRFYQQSAVAIDKSSERSLTRLLTDLANAKKFDVRLEPGNRTPAVDASFDVGGAKDAIAQVYTACKDVSPVQ